MNIKLAGVALSAAFLLSGAQAFAATVTFDTFDTDQYVSDVPLAAGGNTSTVTSANGDILGGSRTFSVTNTATDGSATNATSLASAQGILSFSNTDGSTGRASLVYDGNGAGLGNLVFGANSAFSFDVLRFDNDGNVNFTINGTDGDGNTISYMENLMSGFNPNLTFAEFAGGNTFDFTNVQSLEFIVDTTGLTRSIDGAISGIFLNSDDIAPVPLPASALLLLGAVGGFGALRRRQKA